MKATVRKDLIEKEDIPATLKGFPDWMLDEGLEKQEFRFAALEGDTPEGYNMVVWLPDVDFVDLANTIDFDFNDFT